VLYYLRHLELLIPQAKLSEKGIIQRVGALEKLLTSLTTMVNKLSNDFQLKKHRFYYHRSSQGLTRGSFSFTNIPDGNYIINYYFPTYLYIARSVWSRGKAGDHIKCLPIVTDS
jgi:hypothetical protein